MDIALEDTGLHMPLVTVRSAIMLEALDLSSVSKAVASQHKDGNFFTLGKSSSILKNEFLLQNPAIFHFQVPCASCLVEAKRQSVSSL